MFDLCVWLISSSSPRQWLWGVMCSGWQVGAVLVEVCLLSISEVVSGTFPYSILLLFFIFSTSLSRLSVWIFPHWKQECYQPHFFLIIFQHFWRKGLFQSLVWFFKIVLSPVHCAVKIELYAPTILPLSIIIPNFWLNHFWFLESFWIIVFYHCNPPFLINLALFLSLIFFLLVS